MSFFKNLLKKSPVAGQSQDYFNKGLRHFKQGKWPQSKSAFEKAVELTPDCPKSQFFLGASLFQMGDIKASIGPLRRCVELDPNHSDAHNNLGMALGRLGRYEEAVKHTARAAFLGHPQAPRLLSEMNKDFCRICASPVDYHTRPDVDVLFVSGLPWKCVNCGKVFCHSCLLSKGVEECINPACPECRHELKPLLK